MSVALLTNSGPTIDQQDDWLLHEATSEIATALDLYYRAHGLPTPFRRELNSDVGHAGPTPSADADARCAAQAAEGAFDDIEVVHVIAPAPETLRALVDRRRPVLVSLVSQAQANALAPALKALDPARYVLVASPGAPIPARCAEAVVIAPLSLNFGHWNLSRTPHSNAKAIWIGPDAPPATIVDHVSDHARNAAERQAGKLAAARHILISSELTPAERFVIAARAAAIGREWTDMRAIEALLGSEQDRTNALARIARSVSQDDRDALRDAALAHFMRCALAARVKRLYPIAASRVSG